MAGLSTDEKMELSKQLVMAANRVVADGARFDESVVSPIVGEHETVIAVLSIERIIAAATIQNIIAVAALDRVDPGATDDGVLITVISC